MFGIPIEDHFLYCKTHKHLTNTDRAYIKQFCDGHRESGCTDDIMVFKLVKTNTIKPPKSWFRRGGEIVIIDENFMNITLEKEGE